MDISKHAIWQVVKFFLAFGLIAIVISEINVESVAVLWKRISVSWFLLSVFAFYASIWFMARRYWVLIGTQIEFHDIFHSVLYQNIMGNLVTTAAGAAWYVGTLRNQHKIPITRSVFSLVAARFGDLVTWLVSLSVATLLVWRHIPMLRFMVTLLISLLTGGALVGVMMMVFRGRLVAFARTILSKFQFQRKASVRRFLETLTVFLNQEAHEYVRSISAFTTYSVLTVGSMLLFAYSSLQIFGVRIEIWPVVFVVAITQIISFLPVQVLGGLGLYDLTYLYLYGLFGVDRSEFAAVIVGLRICFYLANLALLPLLVITTRSRKGALVGADEEPL
jgi:uncharacterized protein (TIRG00374 family)